MALCTRNTDSADYAVDSAVDILALGGKAVIGCPCEQVKSILVAAEPSAPQYIVDTGITINREWD